MNTKMKFAPLTQPLDRFTQLAQEHFEAARKSNSQARYQDSFEFAVKNWPHLWQEHLENTMYD